MSTQTEHTSSNRKIATTVGIVLFAVAIALGAWSLGTGDSEPAGVNEGVGIVEDDPVEAAQPVSPADDVLLSFTFTGEGGPDGCRYEGPTAFVEGKYPTEFVNAASARGVAVNLDPLKTGATYDGFLGQIGAADSEPPVPIAPEDMTPERQEWLGGAFRTIHSASMDDQVAVVLLPGKFVIYCWTPDEATGGARVWPAGTITVRAAG